MRVLWIEGSLHLKPENAAERDAMLLLWGAARKSRRSGNVLLATDFGVSADGETDDTKPLQTMLNVATIEP